MMIYPYVAILAMFVLLIIMVILKFGGRLPPIFRLRHTTLNDQQYWVEDDYEHGDSYA